MSDHLDGISTQDDPRLDISDVYLFKGRHGTVFVMNVNPISGTDGFHPEAHYDFALDIDHDAKADLVLRVTFGDRDEAGNQEARLSLLAGPLARQHDLPGLPVARARTGEPVKGLGGVRFWAGSAGEPFYIEGTVVTAVRTAVTEGEPLDLSGFDPEQASNVFGQTNVSGIVIEVPDHFFQGLEIGLWGAVVVPTDDGSGWRQIDRAAIPLMSTLFGFNTSDDYNAALPHEDDERFGQQIQDMVEEAVAANGTHSDPAAYAAEMRERLVPDVLRYRLGTEARFDVDVFNGRDLTVNSPEVMFHLVLNRRVRMYLGPEDATGELRRSFPYLAEPIMAEPPATHAELHERLFGIPPHPRPAPPAHTHD